MNYKLRKRAIGNFGAWTLEALAALMAILPILIAIFR